MRLIYAEDIKKRADCYPPSVRSVVANILSHTKTVKDAVKVVRCKDCVHKEREQPGMVFCPMMVGSWVDEDHFCGWGERRDDES